MWAIIKFENKNLNLLKQDIQKKLNGKVKFYLPKIQLQDFKKNKLKNKEFNLLGDYFFCFHENLSNPLFLNSIKYSRGLKAILEGFKHRQDEIINFISDCKYFENKDGYITKSFFDLNKENKYKFSNGVFTGKIFEILNFQKKNYNLLVNNLRVKIDKKKFLFCHV